jgi:tetratricopeptide (TPR) repeat protein
MVRTLVARLSEKNHVELLALLEQLVLRQPDIEPLIELLMELPLATTTQERSRPGKGRERTLDPSTVRSQVASAFYHAGEGWGAASRAAAELEQLYDIGQNFAEAGEWANAQVVYTTVAEETVMQYEEVHDEGQLSWVLGKCAAGLVKCLEVQSALPQDEQLDTEVREELLTALFDLWKFGSNYGGIEVDVAGAMAERVTEFERKMVESWLRAEMRSEQDFSSQWHNRSIIDFLATLKQVEHFSDEDLLEEYRKAGLYKELAEKLLQLGRENEALGVAQANLIEYRDVTWFAEQLLKAGVAWGEAALGFVEARLGEVEQAMRGKRQDFAGERTIDTYRGWLGEQYSIYGRPQQALKIELTRFQVNPDTTTYRAVRSAAQIAGQPQGAWSDLRPRLIHMLEQQSRWGALVTIYLDEGEVGHALSALAELERGSGGSLAGYGHSYYSAPGDYRIQVAQAAEEEYPEEAIRLYKSVIQKLIDGRGRENYQQAIGYMMRIRMLYQKQEREPEWQAYTTNLRNSNKSLRALKEELDKRAM